MKPKLSFNSHQMPVAHVFIYTGRKFWQHGPLVPDPAGQTFSPFYQFPQFPFKLQLSHSQILNTLLKTKSCIPKSRAFISICDITKFLKLIYMYLYVLVINVCGQWLVKTAVLLCAKCDHIIFKIFEWFISLLCLLPSAAASSIHTSHLRLTQSANSQTRTTSCTFSIAASMPP